MRVSVIVPVLDEAASILRTLASVRPARGQDHVDVEIILVDGGSSDGTAGLAAPHCDQVIHAVRGRANQMNAGAKAASGELLLFLHADTLLPGGAIARLAALAGEAAPAWGRFDVQIDGAHPMLRVVAALMNLRSRLTGIATGDQAIFVTRAAFLAVS
ncbi:MAG: glycosyltransferase family 2 protein, partial [Lacisediminimonas sp.]|nr:glycosyltransferase family 2 protein [Lacisediminimonas sp.]